MATRTGGGVSAIVDYDYIAKEADELNLVKGAIINGIRQIPGGWWEGTLQSNGKTGMFPDNFVRIIGATSDDNAVVLREKSATSNRRCKVIYSYSQVNEDELSLGVGDVIEFLGEVEEGWWRGRLKTKVGVFPSNFVVEIEPSPILASKRPPTIIPTTETMVTLGKQATTEKVVTAATATPNTIAESNNIAAVSAAATTTVAVTRTATTTIAAPATTTIVAATTTTAATTAATTTTTATTTSTTTKKTNRLSFHNSKEDLLNSSSSTTISSSTTAAPSLPPKPQRDFCRVEYPYAPQNDDELELKVGDIITVVNMELPDKGWWKGELRGKVGVFPDNFVKLLASSEVSPLNEAHLQQRTVKKSNLSSASASSSTTNYFQSTTNITAPAAASTTNSLASANSSKIFIKKSGSTSSTQSSNRKDSFGSRDSLNDILSETGLPTGNVAAQRKSLENKNLDLSNAPDASTRLGLKKPQPLQQQEIKASNNNNNATISTLPSTSSNNTGAGELRKSLENMDEKTKTPPPVLTKKPFVPTKKTSTVTSVAGNLLSGLKQKVKNVENKLTTTVSQDCGDGVGSSRIPSGSGGLPDAAPSGNVVMRRANTIAVEDTDFDRVERASILSDMRAGRVKAPKRRPPSTATNMIGESNNNNTVYLNGSADEDANNKTHGSDDNSTGEEQLAQPKPRQWEKKKAPWMEELKASQVKKKTSPNLEPRSIPVTERKVSSSSQSNNIASTSVISSTSTSGANIAINTSSTSSTTKVQSSSISSSVMQQSLKVESNSVSSSSEKQLLKKEQNIANSTTNSSTMPDIIAKSVSGVATTTVPINEDVRATRPNSLSLRNSSVSPSIVGVRKTSESSAPPPHSGGSAAEVVRNAVATTQNVTTAIVNNHHVHSSTSTAHEHTNNIPIVGADGKRVVELERRVEKLETVVHTQQRTIDELVRMLREETDRVKLLRGELDKYAQCVTQV